MHLQIFVGLLILVVASCQNQHQQISAGVVETDTNSATVSKSEENTATAEELVEFFSDDSNIGLPQRNRIEISNFKKPDGEEWNSNLVVIKFYLLDADRQWKLKQSFEFERDGIGDCNPKLEDFNNDGYKDMTYISAHPARGANEIRRLFVYDKEKNELVHIKNSEEYPNIQYNKKLDCLDTWRFYGGYSTEFLKIDGEMLQEFARIETVGDSREVHLVDKNGKERLLRKDKFNENDGFVRYKNFDPPEPYDKH